MNFSFLKKISISVIALLFSLSIHADPVKKDGDSFLKQCTAAWMKNANDAKDVDYKNFGEKYCGCAANQPLGNDQEIQKAIHLCMSRTLLHDTMDALEDDIGLNKVKDSDITDSCNERWTLIYPKQTDADKTLSKAYCDCAKPDLLALVKTADSLTDKDYSDRIDQIADHCSGNAIPNKPTTAN